MKKKDYIQYGIAFLMLLFSITVGVRQIFKGDVLGYGLIALNLVGFVLQLSTIRNRIKNSRIPDWARKHSHFN